MHAVKHAELRWQLVNVLLFSAIVTVKPVPYLPKEREVVRENEQLAEVFSAFTDKAKGKEQRIAIKTGNRIVEHD